MWGSEEVINSSGSLSTYLNCLLCSTPMLGVGILAFAAQATTSGGTSSLPHRQKEGVKSAVPSAKGNAASPQEKWDLQLSQARLLKVWVALYSRHLMSVKSLLFHTQVHWRLLLVYLCPLSPLNSCTVLTLTKYCAYCQCQFLSERIKAKPTSNNYRKLKYSFLIK